jgi:hypothetical protein
MLTRRLFRRSRSDLLWGLLGFAALQGALAALIAFRLPGLRDPSYARPAAALAARLNAAPRPLTVVVLGSSRVQNGLRARAIEERLTAELGRPVAVFNFGIAGAGPLTHLFTWKRLRAQGARPDLVCVEVVPTFLAGAGADPPRELLTGDRLEKGELSFLKRYHFPRGEFREDWWRSWLAPGYAHRTKLLRDLQGYWGRRIDGSGWHEESLAWAVSEVERRRGIEQARREHGDILEHFHLGGASCLALRDLLDLCRRDGVPAALLWMPEGTAFRALYADGAEGEVEAFLAGLGREQGAALLDARRWAADDDFADCHHLAGRGAAAFSERFGREALLPLLRTRYEPGRPHPSAHAGLSAPGP